MIQKIILFDGVCKLCNTTVNFIVSHNKKKSFEFISRQSDEGKNMLKKFGISDNNLGSLIYIQVDTGNAYFHSTAALRITDHLDFPYHLLSLLIFIPTFIRDAIYSFIASHRYKWFGKRDRCKIPPRT